MYLGFFTFISLQPFQTTLVGSGHYVFQLATVLKRLTWPVWTSQQSALLETDPFGSHCTTVLCFPGLLVLVLDLYSLFCPIVLPCVLSCSPQLLVTSSQITTQMTKQMARTLLTGLLVRVHRWPTMFCHICKRWSMCKNPTFYKLNTKVIVII